MACVNSGVECFVRSSCPPRGPKKGYIRELQKQIEDLQTRLQAQQQDDGATANQTEAPSDQASNTDNEYSSIEGSNEVQRVHVSAISSADVIQPHFGEKKAWSTSMINTPLDVLSVAPLEGIDNINLQYNSMPLSAALDYPQAQAPEQPLGLGMHLTPMICTDLDQLYFERVHVFVPMLQKFRYLSWSRQVDKNKARICLQYAMWTLAASLSSQFQLIRLELYAEVRQLLEGLEADSRVCIEQLQAWILLTMYELTSNTANYQRAMVSAGRAFRLAQLMKLCEIDGPNCIFEDQDHGGPGKGNWIDMESMRRTFWVAYILDRFTSTIDGVSLTFNESQIRTRLPAPEAHFMSGRAVTMVFLPEIIGEKNCNVELQGSDSNMSSPFAESILMATICGRALEHKSQPLHIQQLIHLNHKDPQQGFQNPQMDDFCRRHQWLNALVTRRIKALSMHTSSTSEHPDPTLVFVALTGYMTVFTLCDTAFGSSSSSSPTAATTTTTRFMEHKQRALDAVHELDMLTGMLGQLSHFETHPLTPIPLLLSARLCLARGDHAYVALMTGIVTGLQGLRGVNGLAQSCLWMLGRE
ncbi:fungal-specific transcription factor domain-containing protein [Pseudomassariella vexata]|uniref:Fungal-specific transcription factor domain-domain-containing protein n=1 Tax=Pseudomassariella vexata TaxID=1141098 RepID=A0A1Y2EHM6_9PEZI|nr:fungal-specific transcription factor domain-containing protein [Pseudomassariella vexata]ORY71069.1 fungal-specific transcription factor domain-domain-containing protein [Pseudomassariella vexata]